MTSLDTLATRLRAAGCVFAEREAELLTSTFPCADARERAVVRREAGEPLEYVVGTARFGAVDVAIGPPGFIPRARAVALLDVADVVVDSDQRAGAVVRGLDLGCGVGAIAADLTRRHPDWDVHASDVDAAALAWARRNGDAFGFTVHHGSWFAALPSSLRGGFDVVLAHLPSVPSTEVDRLPRDFREHEPRQTVDGGPDGLDPLRAVAATCTDWLTPGGALITQLATWQASTATDIAQAAGLSATVAATSPAEEPGDRDEDTAVLVLRPTADASAGLY